MNIDEACDVMREFGRVCKRRGYIKCDSDLFAGLSAFKAFAGEGFGDEEMNEAYVMARDFIVQKVVDGLKEGA